MATRKGSGRGHKRVREINPFPPDPFQFVRNRIEVARDKPKPGQRPSQRKRSSRGR